MSPSDDPKMDDALQAQQANLEQESGAYVTREPQDRDIAIYGQDVVQVLEELQKSVFPECFVWTFASHWGLPWYGQPFFAYADFDQLWI